MTAAAPAAGREQPPATPAAFARWRHLAWATWRQHRSALAGFAILVSVVAIFIAVTGVVLHRPGSGLWGTGPNSQWPLFDATDTVLKIVLPLLPALAGIMFGAPLVAREIEAGTVRFAWVQAAGRARWLVAAAVLGAVSLALIGLGLGFEYEWWASRAVLLSHDWIIDLFMLHPAPFAGWFVLGFSLGVLFGALVRRTLPAMAATIVSYLALMYMAFFWRPVYLPPLHRMGSDPMFTAGGGYGSTTYWGSQPAPGPDILSTAPGWPDGRLLSGSELNHSPAWFRLHHIQIWLTYQPANRYLMFQIIEFGWLLVLSAVLIAATLVLIRRRAA